MKKTLIIILIMLIAIGAGIVSFLYWGIYDEGIRAGTVLRVSKQGILWKTYEGQLGLESFGALKGVSPLAETFDFSVEPGNDSIVRLLESVALTGERVNLRYIKRYMTFPWRGKTKYFIREVERNPDRQSRPSNQEPFDH